MISPEMLRKFPYFGSLEEPFLKELAMLAQEVELKNGQTIYESGKPADTFYLLVEGCVESYLVITDPDNPEGKKNFYLGDVSPGEAFGISAFVEPYIHTTTTRCQSQGRAIALEAAALQKLSEANLKMGYMLLKQVTKATVERLHDARVQLAASRSG